MILDAIVGGIIFGFAGHCLCKMTNKKHSNDEVIYYTTVPLFFMYGCYKVYSIRNN